jgi:hypothetical protein
MPGAMFEVIAVDTTMAPETLISIEVEVQARNAQLALGIINNPSKGNSWLGEGILIL